MVQGCLEIEVPANNFFETLHFAIWLAVSPKVPQGSSGLMKLANCPDETAKIEYRPSICQPVSTICRKYK